MIGKTLLALLATVLVLAAGWMTALFICRHPTPAEYRQALSSQPVRLPQDEAAHFDVTTEWWYYTGFLTGEGQSRYSFELVFFKVFLPQQVRLGGLLPLNWISNPVYMAHMAVSDLVGQEHLFYERLNFPGFWTAGAREDRFEVWNGSWRAWGGGGKHHLQANAGRHSLSLELQAAKPTVLHGDEGTGVVEMGQAGTSYYYSEPDLRGAGLLTADGVQQAVGAVAWMDHQWGSWPSHGGYDGWDWFSLRLEGSRQVMLFQFRGQDGQQQAGSGGTWIAEDGRAQHLSAADYQIEVLDRWTSPATGGAYPIQWHVVVPSQHLDLNVQATFPEQEMAVQFGPMYWEGSVAVDGTAEGNGFVEMTGYAVHRASP